MKLSLRNIATALLFSGFLHATAEAPDSTIVDRINASETIEVIQPAALQQRLIPNRRQTLPHPLPAPASAFRFLTQTHAAHATKLKAESEP